ncbi:MAG: hypothetical protein LBG43_05950 [Treponema sp.]|nr:hypothetical protein [Treponema sp.]
MKNAFKAGIVGSLCVILVLAGCGDVIIDPGDTSLRHFGGDRKASVSQAYRADQRRRVA